MHIETLLTFCDVVELGSLSRAAQQHRVTQSAVSQQLRALEPLQSPSRQGVSLPAQEHAVAGLRAALPDPGDGVGSTG